MPRSTSTRRSAPARPRGPRLRRSLAAAGLLALGSAAPPQPAAPEAATPAVADDAGGFSAADVARVRALREANARLFGLAERALKFTPTPDVLVIAHQVRDDHARLASDLERLVPAAASGVADPGPVLEGSVSEEFDRAFLIEVVATTESALAQCEEIIRSADAPALRALATDAVVSLDRNLHRLRNLQNPPGTQAN